MLIQTVAFMKTSLGVADDWRQAEECAWHCDNPGEGHRELSNVRKQKYRGCCQAQAQAKCLSFPRKVSSVIVMTRLSRVKMDWTPADAKTHIIVHFLTNKFLSENHQLLVKMNMHQWYILHKYTCVGSGLALDMEEIFHTHNLSNAGPLSVKPCRERPDLKDTRKVTMSSMFLDNSICWSPLWQGSWSLIFTVCHWPWRMLAAWPGRVTRVANIDWRVAPLTLPRSTSNTISESHTVSAAPIWMTRN